MHIMGNHVKGVGKDVFEELMFEPGFQRGRTRRTGQVTNGGGGDAVQTKGSVLCALSQPRWDQGRKSGPGRTWNKFFNFRTL